MKGEERGSGRESHPDDVCPANEQEVHNVLLQDGNLGHWGMGRPWDRGFGRSDHRGERFGGMDLLVARQRLGRRYPNLHPEQPAGFANPADSHHLAYCPGVAESNSRARRRRPTPTESSTRPDAYLNFGTGNYAGASLMTNGTITPWYESPTVTKVFGGVPTPQQQADFSNAVLKNVEQTFLNSGIDVNLSLDPNAQASHTMSVVSGASYGANPNAIGITEVGGSGFSFIDKLGYAQTVEQLERADAYNIAHELMHAFGVATHHDQTGKYLDAATASWDMLPSPDTSSVRKPPRTSWRT